MLLKPFPNHNKCKNVCLSDISMILKKYSKIWACHE